MALRAVLAELSPGSALLLRAPDDRRVARVAARPGPRVEIVVGDRRLATLPCRTHTDILAHLEDTTREHWGLDAPTQLAYAYEGEVSTRLREALSGGDLVEDLPEGERPMQRRHSAGTSGGDDLGGRLDEATLERLRGMTRPDRADPTHP